MNIKKLVTNTLVGTLMFGTSVLPAFAAATVVVSGDTAAGENQPGWLFNRDASTATPYEFNTDAASTGQGSLYVLPIGSNPSDKFIAENFLATPVSDVNSLSYDYKIAGNGDSSDSNQFYVNVYANIDNSTNYYDCRFDYVAAGGSTSSFTTHLITPSDTPVHVQKRGSRVTTCPATLAEMPEGSYVRAFAISVGDTSANDVGLAGYLDTVVVNTTADVTTYDFEPALTPANKDACKKGGWMTFNTPSFTNQGQCVSYVVSHGHNK